MAFNLLPLGKKTKGIYSNMIKSDNDIFHALYDNHRDPIFHLSNDGELINYNNSVKRIFGFNDKELKKDFLRNFGAESKSKRNKYLNDALQGVAQNYTAVIYHKNGTPVNLDVTYIPLFDSKQQVVGIYGIARDITKENETERKLKENEELSNTIYDNLESGIWSFDVRAGEYKLLSQGFEKITGYQTKHFKSMNSWSTIIHPDDKKSYYRFQEKLKEGKALHLEYRILCKDGKVVWVYDQTFPLLDSSGNVIRVDGIITDITSKKKKEEAILYFANHDYLTDLPNRRMFEDKMDSLIENSLINNEGLSLLMLNIDRFKHINDALGHVTADQFLKQFSNRLNEFLPKNALLSRLGGDEFAFIVWNLERDSYPTELAQKVIDSLEEPFTISKYEFYVTVSIGISNYPRDAKTKEELYRNADAALFRAKETGKNNYQIYSSSLSIESYKLYSIERDLRKALKNNEFLLYFQPRVDAGTGKIVSAEALIRWQHPTWGLISPKEFIPLAENNGFILNIGDWVFQQVCNHLENWKQQSIPLVPISLNISAQRFLKSDWMETSRSIVEKSNVDTSLIEFEITESTLIQHEESVELGIHFLNDMGIRIALDDFGTGYSSLSYLKKYPIGTIKIDRSFISNIVSDNRDQAIIKSIIYLANSLEKRVVAEGVETKEQLEFLKEHNCHEIQGYYFSKPVEESTFIELLKNKIIKPKPINQNVSKPTTSLDYPLSAQMSITSIKGKRMTLGKSEILIEDLNANRLFVLSTINLPARNDIILSFETTMVGEIFTLDGYIVWKQEVNDLYRYEIVLIMENDDRISLEQVLNYIEIQRREKTLLLSNFVKEDKYNYLLNKKEMS